MRAVVPSNIHRDATEDEAVPVKNETGKYRSVTTPPATSRNMTAIHVRSRVDGGTTAFAVAIAPMASMQSTAVLEPALQKASSIRTPGIAQMRRDAPPEYATPKHTNAIIPKYDAAALMSPTWVAVRCVRRAFVNAPGDCPVRTK